MSFTQKPTGTILKPIIAGAMISASFSCIVEETSTPEIEAPVGNKSGGSSTPNEAIDMDPPGAGASDIWEEGEIGAGGPGTWDEDEFGGTGAGEAWDDFMGAGSYSGAEDGDGSEPVLPPPG